MHIAPHLLAPGLFALLLAAPRPAPLVSGEGDLAAPLASALDSIDTRSISADVHFIASDELQGRDTPSRGLKIAARYIRARLTALGLEPGAPDGYFYEYPLDFARIDPEATFAMLGGTELVEGEDYFTWFRTGEELDVTGGLVWVGEESEDALAELSVTGSWLVTDADTSRGSRRIRREAEDVGAVGVVRLLDDDHKDFAWLEGSVRRSLEGSVSYPAGEREGSPGKRVGHSGSLLLYPDFDNSNATVTVLTVRKTEDEGGGVREASKEEQGGAGGEQKGSEDATTPQDGTPTATPETPASKGDQATARVRRRGRDDATFPVLHMRRSRFAELAGVDLATLERGKDLGLELRDHRAPDTGQEQLWVENVCGFWRGADPQLADEVIIVSAHYDHVGMQGGEIHNGADDNGSGTCGLLALAEALTHYGPLRRSVMLMWVSGEEKGLYGSQAWTEAPWLPEGCHAVADLNIDMIGRNAPDKLLVTPTSAHDAYNGLTRLAERLAPLEGFAPLGSADEYYERSDHYNFRKNLEIPVAFLFSDVHEDYHKPTDDPDKLDCDKVRRVVRVVMRMLDGLQDDALDL